ncbi:hypothetical protein CROQUDRAFT_69856 [Cronartium quercuum f. sp. fusiforme G11]|uniref:Uncharacterized protein n=1 Tax=Cronartium quercuum f. sp. fusiforme G11 TaxID=708437 RepID=A0A9P6T5X5_9BASI|nr:hypothetical protein CROQUDRAFT_69856 [Cronartium quercuum f. sp. fusiforme G11]
MTRCRPFQLRSAGLPVTSVLQAHSNGLGNELRLRLATEIDLAKSSKRVSLSKIYARCSSSLVYGTPSHLAPTTTSAPLTANTTSNTYKGTQGASFFGSRDDHISIVEDKVENWSSDKYAQHPFQPDFTLFEPIEKFEETTADQSCQEDHSSKLNASAVLCERLVYLIEEDEVAAEEFKSNLLKNRIDLPPHRKINQHCFNILLRKNDIHRYLEWLDIIPDSSLQSSSRSGIIFENHLNHILRLCPQKLNTVWAFFDRIMTKGCLTDSLIRSTVSHLVRTQSPQVVLQFYRKTLQKMCHRSASLKQPPQILTACGQLHNHTILQLANQKYLTEALDLFNDRRDQTHNLIEFPKTISPSTYRVLADQLSWRLVNGPQVDTGVWSDQLEQVLLKWKSSHPISFERWVSSSESFLRVPHGSIMKHKVSRSRQRSLSSRSLAHGRSPWQDPNHTTHRLVLYLRTILSQTDHAKFIKSSHIAENIGRLSPVGSLGGSFDGATKPLDYLETYENEEQYLKALVFDNTAFQSFLSNAHAAGKVLEHEDYLLGSRAVKFQGDVILVWAHCWMIFYQRSRQYERVIDTFLRYFVPLGVDPAILGAKRSIHQPSPLDSTISTSIPLIHPTTGVLSVLYDSILRSSPAKSASTVFHCFLRSLPDSSTSTPCQTSTPHEIKPFSTRRNAQESQLVSRRLQPNSSSFQPFVRAFLRIGDVEKALRLLIEMHLRLYTSPDRLMPDEGAWIDLLEWCASQSAGPVRRSSFIENRNWGIQRKQKRLGWSGEMKERLVYSVLERLLSTGHSVSLVGDPRSISNIIEPTRSICPRALIPQLYAQHQNYMNSFLRQVNWDQLHLGPSPNLAFPTLKLLSRVKAGFESCGNRRGAKILNRLVSWRKGEEVKVSR